MRTTTFVLKSSLLVLVFAAVACPVWAQYSPPSNGLVGWWRGEGGANDSSGNGHNGVLQGGMGFTNGLFGQAFACGTQKRAVVPDDPAFALTNFTIGAWLNVQADSWSAFGRMSSSWGPYSLSGNLDGSIGLYINSRNGTQDDFLRVPISYHQWHQVTVSMDSTAGLMSLYMDGVLAAQKSTAAVPVTTLNPSATTGLGLGNSTSYDFPMLGALDEVVLYSRVLSAAEVASLAFRPCVPHRATASPMVVNGFVVGATITDGGCGYTNTPQVLIQGGSGAGATATAVVSNGVVVGITITDAGIGYTNAPTIYIYAPTGPQIGLMKAVKPAFSDLLPGTNYQLQVSLDLKTWTNQGSAFTATNVSMVYPQYFETENWNQHFFRLQIVP
jgi:hypothetical protein